MHSSISKCARPLKEYGNRMDPVLQQDLADPPERVPMIYPRVQGLGFRVHKWSGQKSSNSLRRLRVKEPKSEVVILIVSKEMKTYSLACC